MEGRTTKGWLYSCFFLTPLNGVPSFLPSMNCPVVVSRLVQSPVLEFFVWLRSLTSPRRCPFPVFFATDYSLNG